MKKKIILTLMLCACLFTGCTKKYNTVDEYAKAMNEVRKNLGDYTIETIISTNNTENYSKSYLKNEKWKTEISKNNGKTFDDGILYDGKEVYSYSKSQKIAMSIPFRQMFSKLGADNKTAYETVMKMINPVGILFYWGSDELKCKDCSLWEFGRVTKKNNFKCRILRHKDGGEICVSDKYGIAVYAKISTPQKGESEFNVKKINNSYLSDVDLDLPSDVKQMSIADLFQDMANMMKTK